MALELHNVTWTGVRLVQVETQPHHLAGVVSVILASLNHSDCGWEDIYSAFYDFSDDGTTTFYESEQAEAGQPGIWTYVVYDCEIGAEEIVQNLEINTLEPALQVRSLVFAGINPQEAQQSEPLEPDIQPHTDQSLGDSKVQASVQESVESDFSTHTIDTATQYVLQKNAELYRRLA
ncbi:hypothetical protein PN441_03430 [Spirulina major CS-329]|uniref:hypothetical protein n=1 Tax=Spirulina TaxID=1154 RepID=UPI00232BFE34|nr:MULTISPECIES: hypothetical protein [Spirulina]MDB9495303.1 hypothetical protein [Spirulina subsalsa CS-330]MDB9502110.1 hypothetical protein [Spirulina major CS-329]